MNRTYLTILVSVLAQRPVKSPTLLRDIFYTSVWSCSKLLFTVISSGSYFTAGWTLNFCFLSSCVIYIPKANHMMQSKYHLGVVEIRLTRC